MYTYSKPFVVHLIKYPQPIQEIATEYSDSWDPVRFQSSISVPSMRKSNHPYRPHQRQPMLPKGLALVATLSLMMLVVIVAVGLLSLASVSLRASGEQDAINTARANARMAMILALGELQKNAGPDQRITMSAGLTTKTQSSNVSWTGTVNVDKSGSAARNPKDLPVTWLVSGDKPDPATELTDANSPKLASITDKAGTKSDIRAAYQNVSVGKRKGRFAWWIGDEGVKARIDMARPEGAQPPARERLARAQSPMEYGIMRIDENWTELAPGGNISKLSLVTTPTAALAANRHTIPSEYFNDVTTGGSGLPVNVVDGGMKADLSLIFDRGQRSKKYSTRYFGVNVPTQKAHNGANIDQFGAPSDPKKFFLSDTLSKNGSVPVGPNWGNLWNYATLWQNVSGQQMPLTGLYPTPWSDLRQRNWLPYTNHNAGPYQNDLQHTNSPVAPVIATLQMGFRLKSQPVKAATANQPALYKAQVEIKPLLGIWNPYNVTIQATPYRFDWALYPFFRFNYARPDGTDARLTRLWLRREWGAGAGDMPTAEKQDGGRYFSMETPAVDLNPGEFRLFSVTKQVSLTSQSIQKLEPAWSEKGAFVVDLTYKTKNANNEIVYATREVPAGYLAWFGDIVLQDTYAKSSNPDDDFNSEFPGFDHEKNASTWFTFKAGGNVLFRTTDLWNAHPDASTIVPEPVVSGWKGGAATNTTKEKHPIEKIAGDDYVPHIATWSVFTRTTTQMMNRAANQRLRGWADTNPRAAVSQPAWDGSTADKSGRKGWHFTSNLMGGAHDPAPRGSIGDGGNDSPNRGLIGEGGRAEPEPQIWDIARYSGYGGASNTPTGQPNVVVYDVPRGPLVSLGQFQHAQLSRYNFEPGFVVGNSYANPRIPLNGIVSSDFNGTTGLNIADTSHEVNRRLWDRFFFSSLAADYVSVSSNTLDKAFDFKAVSSGSKPLPNPRMQFVALPGDTSFDNILTGVGAADRGPEMMAARIRIKGAFNVNSTSKNAWKALLSTMGASQLPVVSESGGRWSKLSWNDPKGIRFNRFGHVLADKPYEAGNSGDGPEFWRGWRNLSEQELDDLATEIVKEVKERGPFRSLAEFVNRNPGGNKAQQTKGCLQAALDRTVNAKLPTDVGFPAANPTGDHFSKAVANENQAVGSASYLMQGDVLQALAPVLQVRSDYFRIRTCGEALDASGKVTARVRCEAFVQRVAEFVDAADPVHSTADEIKAKPNQLFGRKFRIVSFRWLSDSDI